MISSHERSDIIHIMKMNQFVLTDSDTAHMLFACRVKNQDYKVSILVVENQPQANVERNGKKIFNDIYENFS